MAAQVFQASGNEVVGIDLEESRRQRERACGLRLALSPAELIEGWQSALGDTSCKLAIDTSGAVAAVRSAWADIASGELTIHLLSSNRRELTRLVRRLLNELGHGGVARVGSAVGFKRGSTEALNDADSIINIACIRKTWQFWR